MKKLKCLLAWALYCLICVPLALNQLACDHDTATPPDNDTPADTTDIIDTIPVYDEPCKPLPLDKTVQGKILFSSFRSGEYRQLYVMNPDGSDIRQLTFGAFQSLEGRWSKDGSKIIFRSDSIQTTMGQGLYIMDANGKNIHALRENFYFGKFPLVGWQPDWSPDGQKLVFISCFQCEPYPDSHLFISSSDETQLQQITDTQDIPFGGVTPTWSPDGTKIAFARGEIIIIDADGKNPRKVPIDRLATSTAWSPDGCKIVFKSSAESNRWGELFIFDLKSSTVSQVTFYTSNEVFLYPRWSPDCEKLVFESQLTDGSGRSFIYTVNVDGTNLKRLLDDSTANFPDWSWK